MEKIPYGLYSKELRKEAAKDAALLLPSRYSCNGNGVTIAQPRAASPSFILIGRQIASFVGGAQNDFTSHAGEGTASATVKAGTV